MTAVPSVVVLLSCAFLYHQVYGGNSIKCYYCINDCEPPLNSLDCQALDNNVSCYSSITTTEDGAAEQLKGCSIDEDTDFQDYCDKINESGGWCYTCSEDLCNGTN